MHFTVKEANPSLYEVNVASLENECNKLSETKNDRLIEILGLFSTNSEISRDLATRVMREAKSRKDKVFNKRLLCLIGSQAGPLEYLFCKSMKKEELITLFSSTDGSTAYTIPRSILRDRLSMSVNGEFLNVPYCSPKTLRELIRFCYCGTLSKDLTDTQFEEIVQLMERSHSYDLLTSACHFGQLSLVQYLLQKGKRPIHVAKLGISPLLIACKNGHIDIVKLLIEKGADIHQATNSGENPLFFACQEGDIDIVNLLIEKGADIHQATNSGASPLLIACENGHIDIVKLLIEKGADIHQVTNNGGNPLFFACQAGDIDIVNLLIEKGADIHQAINSGASPLLIACHQGHIDVVKLLRNLGAKALKGGPKLPLSQRIDSSLVRWISLDNYFINMSTRISERKSVIRRALENDGSWKGYLNSLMKSTYSRSTEVRSLLQDIRDKFKLDRLDPGTFLGLYEEHMHDVVTLEPILNPVRDLDGAGQHSWEMQSILGSLERHSRSPLTKNPLMKTDLRPDWSAIPLTAIYEHLS